MDPRSSALEIARSAIAAADPGPAVRRAIATGLKVVREGRKRRQLRLLAIGKAAVAMESAARSAIGVSEVDSLLVLPEGTPAGDGPGRVLRGGHPVPNSGSSRAGSAVLDWIRDLPPKVPLLVLLSGGGSSILEVPSPPLELDDLIGATEGLLGSGAPIQILNLVRRHLSEVKGGRLRLACGDRQVGTLAVSDVVGDAPHDIASGPTVPDPTRFSDAVRAMEEHSLRPHLPSAVVRHLEEGSRGRRPETPKPGNPAFRRSEFRIVASNRASLRVARGTARRLGYRPILLTSRIVGGSQDVAQVLASILREIRSSGSPAAAPACVLAGGETTVKLPRKAPPGGRNQEFALAAALALDGADELGVLAMGTDGVDGTTDAAGAWVDGATVGRARELGLKLPFALLAHNSHAVLDRLGALVRTGPTGTNVMDLYLGLAGRLSAGGTAGNNPRSAARSNRRRRS